MKTYIILWLCIVCLVMNINHATAQQMLQDASGEASLYLASTNYSWLRYNSSSTSGEFGINRVKGHDYDFNKLEWNYNIGGSMTVGLKDALGIFYKERKVNPNVGFNIIAGLSTDKYDGNEISAFFNLSSKYKGFDLLNTSKPDTLQFDSFKGWVRKNTFNINWNHQFKKDAYLFFGVAVGLYSSRFNNDELDAVTIQDSVRTIPGQTVIKSRSGLSGSINRIDSKPFRADLALLPVILGQNSVGFNTYFSQEKELANLGIGIFFTKENEPKSIIGGIALEFQDLNHSNPKNSTKAWERAIGFFYLGYIVSAKSE